MKSLIVNEKGGLLPYVLLLFVIICTAAVFGTGIFVSKQKTALFLTDYYETKVMELMTLQQVLPSLDKGEALSGSFRTDRGEVVYAAAPNEGEELVVIHLKTLKTDTYFSSRIIYNMAERQIVQWIE
ncbi:hypothetical protein F9802_01120 [Bacillus aerolatus]|uniref:Competence protein ComG n=1 Tax=Bacillus aerolatus TaxID=2653354 RepID=A0A6I1FND6_9BACI|nr:competence type IV pilus minor pilin ComGG [Bacillus aerolatus]KAB7708781.1 hypothetical protein F9802_01120 [Bacillus aerolatus]